MPNDAVTHFANLLASELEAAQQRWMKAATKVEFEFADRGTFDSSMRVHQTAERLSEGIVLCRECIFDKWRSYVRPRFPSLLESDRTNFADAALRALDKAIADALSHFHGRPKPGLTFGLESAHLISSTGDRERRLLGHELRLDMSTPPPGTAAVNVVTHGSNSPVNVGSGALNQHVNTAEGMNELVAALTALLAAMNQVPDLAQLNDVRGIVIEAKEEATKSKPNKLKLRVVLTGIKDSLQGIAAVQPAWEVVHRVIQMLGLGA